MLSIESLQVTAHERTLLDVRQQDFINRSFCAVLGPNGAGKSTFLNAIMGIQAREWKVLFHGKRLNDWNNQERAQHIAVLPQFSNLSFGFLAKEVVELGLTPLSLGRDAAQRVVQDAMHQCDCLHLASTPYPELSGGEKQRVNLARVLTQLSQARLPPMLLLDESLSAQDLGHQHALLDLIQQICKEKNMLALAVLHDLNHALGYCNEAVLIYEGVMAERGRPQEILSERNVLRYWGYNAEFATTFSGRKLIA